MASPKTPLEFTLMAGGNGAGKSTIASQTHDPSKSVYINPDAIERARGLTSIETGRIVIRQVNEAIERKWHSITLETTLSGTAQLQMLEKAQAEGFTTAIVYVGLASPRMHLERVAKRVASGGHDIPTDAIVRRIEKSYDNLARAAGLVDRLELYDNSTDIPLKVGEKVGADIVLAPDAPQWAINVANKINAHLDSQEPLLESAYKEPSLYLANEGKQGKEQTMAEYGEFTQIVKLGEDLNQAINQRSLYHEAIEDSLPYRMNGEIDLNYTKLVIKEMAAETAFNRAVLTLNSDQVSQYSKRDDIPPYINELFDAAHNLHDWSFHDVVKDERNMLVHMISEDLQHQMEVQPENKVELQRLHQELLTHKVDNRTFRNEPSVTLLDREQILSQGKKEPIMSNIDTIAGLATEVSQTEVLLSYDSEFAKAQGQVNSAKNKLSHYKEQRKGFDAKINSILTAGFKNGEEVFTKHFGEKPIQSGKTRERQASDKLEALKEIVKDPAKFGAIKDKKALEMLTTQKVVMDYTYNVDQQKNLTRDMTAAMNDLGKMTARNYEMARRFGKDVEFNEFARARTPEARLETRLVQGYLANQGKLSDILEKASPELKKEASAIKVEGLNEPLNAGDKVKPHAVVRDLTKAVMEAQAKTEAKTNAKTSTKKMGM